MQKSKKMMVSLCGLALSSLFVLNNKSVVRADTVDGTQNNAITWDSDNDDSQVVNNTQTKTEQSNIQKADDHQQNATQTVQNNAEMSTVRSSSEQRPLTNQNEANKSTTSVQDSRVNLISKVNDAQTDNKVEITNPANNKVHVHYIKNDGASAGAGDYDIDVSKPVSNGQFNVPKGYQLANNQTYSVTMSTHNDAIIKGSAEQLGNSKQIQLSNDDAETLWGTLYKYAVKMINDHSKNIITISGPEAVTTIKPESISDFDVLSNINDNEPKYGIHYQFHAVNAANGLVFCLAGNNSSDDGFLSDTDRNTIINMWNKYTGQDYNNTQDLAWSGQLGSGNATSLFVIQRNRVSKTDYMFNSNGVKLTNGNTVNVVLTKPNNVDPSKVDPNSPGYRITHSSATRTIQINFPGQLPPSYQNIVDAHGNITQVVNFTRDATVDTLLDPKDPNYVISEGPWKSDNKDPNFIGFPERTLPRIPGYTLKITSASVQA